MGNGLGEAFGLTVLMTIMINFVSENHVYQRTEMTPLTGWEKSKLLQRRVYTVVTNDVKYFFCFLAAMIMRLIGILFSTYMLLWVSSYVDSGYLTTQN